MRAWEGFPPPTIRTYLNIECLKGSILSATTFLYRKCKHAKRDNSSEKEIILTNHTVYSCGRNRLKRKTADMNDATGKNEISFQKQET